MNTFTWLLIGHLLGDWLLQNDWMAREKRRGVLTLAGAVHAGIYTAATAGVLWLAGQKRGRGSFLGLSTVILISHWLIDGTDLVDTWMRLYRQSRLAIVRTMVDQTLHLVILALVSAVFPPRVK